MALDEFDGGGGGGYKPPKKIAPPIKKKAPISKSQPGKKYSGGGSSGGNNGSSGGGYSGGGSKGGYSGGGGSATPGYSAPKAPVVPTIGSYLGTDDAYQQAVRGGKRSLTDFLSELNRRRGEAGTTFNQTKSTMETDRVSQLEGLRDEFASRGMIQSGLFGKEQGRFQEQFDTQRRGLEQQQAGLLADLLGQEKNYRREQQLALEVARQEALARRAQRYKIGG